MATVTTNYSSTSDSTAITITLAGLATSSSLTVGQQSAVISNATDKFLDVRVRGLIQTAASGLTANTAIAIYAFGDTRVVSDTPNFPYAGATELGTSDAGATLDAEQRNALKLGQSIIVNATGSRYYQVDFNIAPLFGGWMPLRWGLFVTHNTGAALQSGYLHYTGIKTDITS